MGEYTAAQKITGVAAQLALVQLHLLTLESAIDNALAEPKSNAIIEKQFGDLNQLRPSKQETITTNIFDENNKAFIEMYSMALLSEEESGAKGIAQYFYTVLQQAIKERENLENEINIWRRAVDDLTLQMVRGTIGKVSFRTF